jgi:hypothetical protein
MPADSKLPDNILPRRVEIWGQGAWVTWMDELWHPVSPDSDKAVQGKAILDDGSRIFFIVAEPSRRH